jgi:TonB family protein
MLRAASISVAFHVLAFAIFMALPDTQFHYTTQPIVRMDLRNAIKLVAPRTLELTQKDPNDGKVTQELDIRSALPQAPSPRAFRPPAPAGPAELPAPVLGPAPQIEATFGVPEIASAAGIQNVPRPVEQPKIVLENVGPAPNYSPPEDPLIRAPRVSVEEAARVAAGGGAGGLNSDGQAGDPGSVGNMQLMSDPQGVDFKPYMLQILAEVRRNWFRVIPAIARTGRPGLVQVQFSINKRGEVPKLVIASTSGTLAFDRAAVASISASYPFPPLPAEYGGTEIRLQLAFSYNLRPGR